MRTATRRNGAGAAASNGHVATDDDAVAAVRTWREVARALPTALRARESTIKHECDIALSKLRTALSRAGVDEAAFRELLSLRDARELAVFAFVVEARRRERDAAPRLVAKDESV